jgi:hypothetical protein
MPFDPVMMRRFVHDALKPIDAIGQSMSMWDTLPDRDVLNRFVLSLQTVGKGLEDMSSLSICDQKNEQDWQKLDAKPMVEKHLESLKRKTVFESKNNASNFTIRAESNLLKRALTNMAWFMTHFSNKLHEISITNTTSEKPSLTLSYTMESKEDLDKEFDSLKPFTPLSKETLALTHNTGWILFTVAKILELHDGILAVHRSGRVVVLEISIPLAN